MSNQGVTMLSNIEINTYINNHALSEDAVNYIHSVRDNDPSRMVGVNAKNNVVGAVSSKKWGFLLHLRAEALKKHLYY